jgi:hypothetical protein
MDKTDFNKGAGTRLTVAEVLRHYGMADAVPRSGFIRSPFRDERTPSFHILPHGYAWADFGDGSKGGVIDLVMRLENCAADEAVEKLREIRSGNKFNTIIQKTAPSPRPQRAAGFKVISVSLLSDESLLAYAGSRGISRATVQRFCAEVAVRAGGKVRTYIGFLNSLEGFVLRSPEKGRAGKRCTSSAPTYLNADGLDCAEGTSESVAVFEGLFDFLSYMEMRGRLLRPGEDVCVLNSVVNASAAAGFINSHKTVDLYLDNDGAGRKASREIADGVLAADPKASVIDHSEEYKGFNDLNEWLQNASGGERESAAEY